MFFSASFSQLLSVLEMLRTCHVAVALLGVAAAGVSAATAPMSPRNSRTGAQQQQQQQQRQGMNLNVDLGLLAENKAHGVLGGQNGHVLHRATATGVYPGWDRGMWSRVSVSTGNWTPGDPINNTTKIPLGVGLNYLHQMLQMAIEVEHSVIPPYLTAMYSVISDGTDHEAWVAGTVRDVVIEEMLHMTIACNVLNAVSASFSRASLRLASPFRFYCPPQRKHPSTFKKGGRNQFSLSFFYHRPCISHRPTTSSICQVLLITRRRLFNTGISEAPWVTTYAKRFLGKNNIPLRLDSCLF